MGHSCKKWVTLVKMSTFGKWVTIVKIVHTRKYVSHWYKWVTLGKWVILGKWDTLGKMGHSGKNGSHLETWATLGKMGHTLKNGLHYKYFCSSAISTWEVIENKRRLQALSIDNAWSNKNFLYFLTFRMLQHTSSEVNGYNCYKHLKIQK